MTGSSVSRRTVLAGLGGAGVLVATLEGPLASVAGASRSAGAADAGATASRSIEVLLADVRFQRLFDEAGRTAGHAMYAAIVDGDGGVIGGFTGTQVGGTLMVHEAVVDGSVLLGMGSGETFAVIGATGAFAGVSGGYVIDLDLDASGVARTGSIHLELTGA